MATCGAMYPLGPRPSPVVGCWLLGLTLTRVILPRSAAENVAEFSALLTAGYFRTGDRDTIAWRIFYLSGWSKSGHS